MTASHTEATLRYTSLAGSWLTARKLAGSFGSAVMYQRNTWVSSSSLITPQTPV